jgi:hypothetical protein
LVPVSRGKNGNADLYERSDLMRWVESTKEPESVS